MRNPEVTDADCAAALAYVVARAVPTSTAYAALLTAVRSAVVARDVGIGVALKALGFSRTDLDTVPTGSLLNKPATYVVPAARATAVAALAVRVLNHMEQEIATDNVVTGSTGTIRVGTEFSFSDGLGAADRSASVHLDLVAKKDRTGKKEHQVAPHAKAESTIDAWATAAVRNRKTIPGAPTVTAAIFAGKAEYAHRILYSFPTAQATPAWTWYWVADIDMACYETQTQPSTIDELQHPAVRAIIEQHIFGGAADLKLHPDPQVTGGGGHLSIDLSSGFGYTETGATTVSFGVLLSTLVELQATCRDLQRQFIQPEKGARAGEVDLTNAPWLKDQQLKAEPTGDVLAAYNGVVNDLHSAVQQGTAYSITQLIPVLVEFNRKLTNPANQPGARKTEVEHPDAISHYQAVNIEHLDDDAEPDRRLEIRDIPAQTSYAKLVTDLTILGNSLAQTRNVVKLDQRARLTNAPTI